MTYNFIFIQYKFKINLNRQLKFHLQCNFNYFIYIFTIKFRDIQILIKIHQYFKYYLANFIIVHLLNFKLNLFHKFLIIKSYFIKINSYL